jgi:DNA invertase Pin-like site-specific DNA recombinase
MRVCLYVRVSTDKQEVDNQLIQLRAFCKAKGYDVVNEYVDIISGKETSRVAYDSMFVDAHKRLFDGLVFWDLSRFSRAGTLHTLQKLRELEGCGINWISYSEPYLSSVGDFKDVVLSILSTLAKIEREKISERTKAGLARAKAQGKGVGKRGKDKAKRSNKGYKDRWKKKGGSK